MSKIKKDEEITKNISAISHELQTPINLICATAKLVSYKNNHNDELKRYTRNIVNNCNKLTMILSNLLDINMLAHSKYEYVRLRQFFDAIYYTIRPYLRVLDVKIKLEFKTEIEFAYFPPVTMERIILNLITNAIKYNDKEKKTIRFRISDKDGYIVFSVKDNGMGIDEEHLEKLTEPFYRVNKDVSSGVGMGLTLVEKYVENINGSLKIKSKKEKGTEVLVSIPCNVDYDNFDISELTYFHYPEKASYDIEFSQFCEND
ncbi:MAG: HAMP domain-containing histidine kinase [Clostridia bacterium]|nr:HAMP domain-containing histidine kinase [Clostridia bacterium]